MTADYLLIQLNHCSSWFHLETVIRMRHDDIVVIFQKFAIISHNPVGYSAFNHFDGFFSGNLEHFDRFFMTSFKIFEKSPNFVKILKLKHHQ